MLLLLVGVLNPVNQLGLYRDWKHLWRSFYTHTIFLHNHPVCVTLLFSTKYLLASFFFFKWCAWKTFTGFSAHCPRNAASVKRAVPIFQSANTANTAHLTWARGAQCGVESPRALISNIACAVCHIFNSVNSLPSPSFITVNCWHTPGDLRCSSSSSLDTESGVCSLHGRPILRSP